MKMRKLLACFIITILTLTIIGCGDDMELSGSMVPEPIAAEESDTVEESVETPSATSSLKEDSSLSQPAPIAFNIADIPAFSGMPYVKVNNNTPYFSDSDLTTSSYEYYSDLDSLGRCGVAIASIGQDLMPTEERGAIGSVKPTGWHSVKYDFVDGKYLYNRCHLIGYQLSGENANTKNLITGTRYMNVDGMLPFENMVADYIEETNNHVLYRVTPIFEGDNLLCTGVLMEGKSVEDNGEDILFCVFCYNAQPGVTIDYATGDNSANGEVTVGATGSDDSSSESSTVESTPSSAATYVVNTNTRKFHKPSCYSVSQMKDSNKMEFNGSRDELLNQGYNPCKNCNP